MDLARIVPFFVLLVLGLTLAVCASPGALGVPDGPPTVRGAVARIQHSATASGLLVEPGGGACGLQATADAGTRVVRRDASGRPVPVGTGAEGVGALSVGDSVSVWVDGPVMESCPMQGRAALVVVETPTVDADALLGRWVHAAEEDAGGVEVYRRGEAEDFPPRMYRQRYVFFEGGRAEALVPHPADAHYLAEGTWSLDGGVLVVRYEGRTDRLRVVTLGPDRLQVERVEPDAH